VLQTRAFVARPPELSQLRHAEAAVLVFKLAHNDNLTNIKR
jgi:hypothetical protein